MSRKTSNSSSPTPYGLNAFKLGIVSDNLNHLMGEVLTVIDASTEGDKNKAIKDLIREKFSSKHQVFCDFAWKRLEESGEGHVPRSTWEDELVPFDSSKSYSFK